VAPEFQRPTPTSPLGTYPDFSGTFRNTRLNVS
jgi:hypothetical protein